LALPLETEPNLAADPILSVRIACHYWMTHGLNAPADADNIILITRLINGGSNGLASRQRALARAKEILCA
jgi:putative chitinase